MQDNIQKDRWYRR